MPFPKFISEVFVDSEFPKKFFQCIVVIFVVSLKTTILFLFQLKIEIFTHAKIALNFFEGKTAYFTNISSHNNNLLYVIVITQYEYDIFVINTSLRRS